MKQKIIEPHVQVNDMGWDVVPWSLYDMFKKVYNRFHLPIIVTEHGTAENRMEDNLRVQTLCDAFACIHQARSERIPVIGYCHWSLIDNFEWESGRKMRFGLYHTDYNAVKKGKPRLTPRKKCYIL